MKQNGCLPDGITYNTIIRGFLGQQKGYKAVAFLEELVGRGFSPSASNFSSIIDLISTEGEDPSLQKLIRKFMPRIDMDL